jgi:hypothetical protein
MRPLLLLDVDGVLLPFGSPTAMAEHYNPARFAAKIKRLAEAYEIHWCTGWEDDANKQIAPLLGMEQLPVVPLYSNWDTFRSEGYVHWKHSSILKYMEKHEGRPYAFIDDDISEIPEFGSAPHLWVKTDPLVGITDEHVDLLLAWVESLDLPGGEC